MGRPKLSDWQDGNTKPTTVGVYQRKNGDKTMWSYWHGEFWNAMWTTKEYALSDRRTPFISGNQNRPWRGKL